MFFACLTLIYVLLVGCASSQLPNTDRTRNGFDLMPVAAVMSPLTYGDQPRRFALGSDRLAEVHRIARLVINTTSVEEQSDKGQGGVRINPKLVSGYYSTHHSNHSCLQERERVTAISRKNCWFSVFCFHSPPLYR
jgi:hypothetical protein